MSVMTEITPLKHIGAASGLMGAVFAASSLIGPLIGGALSEGGTWRWVFLLKYVSPLILPSSPYMFFFPNKEWN